MSIVHFIKGYLWYKIWYKTSMTHWFWHSHRTRAIPAPKRPYEVWHTARTTQALIKMQSIKIDMTFVTTTLYQFQGEQLVTLFVTWWLKRQPDGIILECDLLSSPLFSESHKNKIHTHDGQLHQFIWCDQRTVLTWPLSSQNLYANATHWSITAIPHRHVFLPEYPPK